MKGKGIFTSEFLMTFLGIVGSIAGTCVGYLPPDLTVKIVAGLVAIYTIARTIVKLTPSTKDDEMVDKIGEIIKKLGGQVPDNK